MKKITALAAIIMIFSTFSACSGEISGTVSVKGSGPCSYLALTTDDGEVFKITGEPAEELRQKHQGSKVRLKGRVVEEARGPAPVVFEAHEIIE